jgi:predicted ester cyclase
MWPARLPGPPRATRGVDLFEPERRGHEAILHATAQGRPFGLEGRGRPVQVRFLHIFDFSEGLISRESAWLDMAAVHQQLSG